MPDTVATPSASYNRQEERRRLCRAEMGGTQAMRALDTEGLLKFDSEDRADYDVRLADSFLVPYFENAVDNVVGKVFAKPLTLSEDAPPRIAQDTPMGPALWSNVDLQGASADLFLYGVGRDAVVNGLSFVIVDMPAAEKDAQGNPKPLTAADEAKRRPYWKQFKAQDVIEAQIIYESGLPKLNRLRVLAKAERPDGEWGSTTSDRVLVYERGTKARQGTTTEPAQMQTFARFRVFEKQKDAKGEDEWVELPDEGGTFQPPRSAPSAVRDRFVEIPCVPFYTEKTNPFEADPPLRDSLGDLCLQHWRKKSILDNAITVANWMQMVYNGSMADFIGANSANITTNDTKTLNKRELRVGPMGILCTGAVDRSLIWLEHGGVAMQTAQADLERLEKQIQQAALDPFTRQPQGTETATAQILAEGRTMTRAQVWATSWEASGEELLDWTAAWLGLADGGSMTFGKGVMESLAAGDDFGQVLSLFEKGEIDGDTVIQEAKRRGILAPEVERAVDAGQRREAEDMPDDMREEGVA